MRQEPKLFSSNQSSPPPPQDGFRVEPRQATSHRHERDDDEPVFRIPWRLLIAVAVVFVLAVVAWQVIGAMGRGTVDTGDVPLFRAATEPFKQRPDEPGGLDVPNQDVTVYDTLGTVEEGEGMEVLLPEPEEPVVIEAPAPDEGVADVGAVTTTTIDESAAAGTIAPADPLALVVEGTPAPTSSTGLPLPLPRPQAPVATEPTVIETAAVATTDATAATAGTGVLSFDDVAVALGTDGATGTATTATTATETVIVVPQDELAAEVAAALVTDTTTAPAAATVPSIVTGTGDVWVQIAAYSTRADAEAAWQMLASRNADLLGSVSPRVTETQIAGATFHRLQVGTFASAEQAGTLCDALRQRQIDCVIVGH